jgi:glycosyltransferase involved in cell wall biosynthesis
MRIGRMSATPPGTEQQVGQAPRKHTRVLQVITHLALGGAERMCFTLMRGLRDRFDFGVFAVLGAEQSKVGEGFKHELDEMNVPLFTGTKVPMKMGGMFTSGRKLKAAIKTFQPDVIHLHTEIPESAYAAMTALPFSGKAKRVPLVRTVHNTVIWVPWRKLGRWCERHMKPSHIAAVSTSALESYKRHREQAGAGALPAEPVVIYNGVAEHEGAPWPRPDTGAATRVLFAGRLEPQKGADLLPEILRRVDPVDGRVNELVIFGSGSLEDQLKALKEDPPTGWVVRVEGPVPDLRKRMSRFDLFIMPSRYEGFGLVAVEALLGGLPVVATTAPGLAEVFPQGYPFLSKPDDADAFASALQTALRSREQWPAAVQSGAAMAREKFGVAAMCDAYAKLYGDVGRSTRA